LGKFTKENLLIFKFIAIIVLIFVLNYYPIFFVLNTEDIPAWARPHAGIDGDQSFWNTKRITNETKNNLSNNVINDDYVLPGWLYSTGNYARIGCPLYSDLGGSSGKNSVANLYRAYPARANFNPGTHIHTDRNATSRLHDCF
jgi:hypothetical protein